MDKEWNEFQSEMTVMAQTLKIVCLRFPPILDHSFMSHLTWESDLFFGGFIFNTLHRTALRTEAQR